MKTEIIQILTGFIGSFGFAILFNIRGKRLIMAALGGFLSWSLFIAFSQVFESEHINYFFVSFIISIYAEIMARWLKTPTTTFITTSLVPLIPGSSLYYTMVYAFESNTEDFMQKGLDTLLLASALALGIIVAATVMKLITKLSPLR